MARKFRVTIGGTTYNVEVEEIGGTASPAAAPARVAAPAPAPVAAPAPAPAPVAVGPAAPPAEVISPKSSATPAGGGEVMRAPLPGMIVGVKVQVGQKVGPGDVVVVLEAMKMENDIAATAGGVVKQVMVDKGSSVALGDPLIVIG